MDILLHPGVGVRSRYMQPPIGWASLKYHRDKRVRIECPCPYPCLQLQLQYSSKSRLTGAIRSVSLYGALSKDCGKWSQRDVKNRLARSFLGEFLGEYHNTSTASYAAFVTFASQYSSASKAAKSIKKLPETSPSFKISSALWVNISESERIW